MTLHRDTGHEWAKCCVEGGMYLERHGSLNGGWVGWFGGGDCQPLRFCPFCGHDLSLPPMKSLEEALTLLLTSDTPLRLCFDVDGVCADDRGLLPYPERSVYTWVPDLMRRLKAAGHRLIFHTARYMLVHGGDQNKAREEGHAELCGWLNSQGIPFDEVYLGKPSAEIYVDDRGCRVESNLGTTNWVGAFMATLLRTQAKKKRKVHANV